MGRWIKAPIVDDDLLSIWKYIAQDNKEAATRTVKEIEEMFGRLAEMPHMGRSREDFRPDLRSCPIGNYIIIYRAMTESKGVSIARVFEGHLDYERYLR